MRPNQIYAVSLYYSMLDSSRAEQVVAAVQRELLTPYGVRTLASGDSRYARQYQGDSRARDSAYHQGTVWPWLLGPFIEAYLRVHEHSDQAVAQAREWMEPLRVRMSEYGLGQVSEVCDAEPPYSPGGCIAQAWSVAQLLGALASLKAVSERLATVAGD